MKGETIFREKKIEKRKKKPRDMKVYVLQIRIWFLNTDETKNVNRSQSSHFTN